ncbi:YbdK family carboxylate-amine ligase [Pseudonocardiaceae bacterium YIM PH 21723]|nr:YbdK family carboxylate-amine ligase [Pseudonocardiaceae bacterium YIM PH 21723]
MSSTDPGGVTLGVEEEFLLVDAETGHTTPRAPQVLAAARDVLPADSSIDLQAELATNQVELATGVHRDAQELCTELTQARTALADAAEALGARLLPVAVPLLQDTEPPTTLGNRYDAAMELFGGMLAGYQPCGCHVHVGVPDREEAVQVVNHVRPWLPTLLALSVNSPFDNGRDTRFGSWRTMVNSRFPTFGLPPVFGSAADHDRRVAAMVEQGVVLDKAMTFWMARPSHHLPTVEMRAADVACTVEEAVFQAVLCRGLVRTVLADVRAGKAVPEVVDDRIAIYVAAREGLAGDGLDPRTGKLVPATSLVDELIGLITPALEETGDLDFVRRLYRQLLTIGTGAARQRAAAEYGLPALIAMLAGEAR